MEADKSKNGDAKLAEVTVDKLRQSLKRDLDGKAVYDGNSSEYTKNNGNQTASDDAPVVAAPPPHKSKRKPSVKYNGLSELELSKRHLPDHLVLNLDILIVGMNPSLQSVFKGHHYAGPGHHFWKCIHTSGLVPHAMNACEDYRLPQFGVGFTNVVPRATKSASDLTKEEVQEGRVVLIQKIKLYKPRIVVLVGKGVFDIFYSSNNFCYGKQSIKFPETDSYVFVIPSATGCGSSYWPRVQDKLPFFQALRKLRDYVKGVLPVLREEEVIFPISSSANSSHSGGNGGAASSTGGSARRSANTEGRGGGNADRSAASAVMSPCPNEVVESQGAPSSPGNSPPNGEYITGGSSSGGIPPNMLSMNGQRVSPIMLRPHNFWSEMAPPAANSTFICHQSTPKFRQSPSDDTSAHQYATNASSVVEQLEDSYTASSPLGTQYAGPVVYHHSSSGGSPQAPPDPDGALQHQMLLLNPSAAADHHYAAAKQASSDMDSSSWAAADMDWSINQQRYQQQQQYYHQQDGGGGYVTDEYKGSVSNDSAADFNSPPPPQEYRGGWTTAAADRSTEQRNDSSKVLFEWYPVGSSGSTHYSSSQSTNDASDSREFTRLYFLDDDPSTSVEPVIRQLIPASEL